MISLNNKDADFIANILRDAINNLEGSREQTVEFLKVIGIYDELSADEIERYIDESDEELKAPYIKAIELLMGGSNDK